MTRLDTHADARWNPLEAVLTWVLPGLGHLLLGQRARGVIIGVTILSLWLAGAAIGGVGVLDHTAPAEQTDGRDYGRRDFNYWFLFQGLLLPSVAVDVALQLRWLTPAATPALVGPRQYAPSLSRVNEQGVLYTGMAGLLNLLAAIDVAYREPRRRSARPEPAPA